MEFQLLPCTNEFGEPQCEGSAPGTPVPVFYHFACEIGWVRQEHLSPFLTLGRGGGSWQLRAVTDGSAAPEPRFEGNAGIDAHALFVSADGDEERPDAAVMGLRDGRIVSWGMQCPSGAPLIELYSASATGFLISAP
jgi:hypothetical protein